MSSVKIAGDTSGLITLAAPAAAGTNTITMPASTGTMALTGDIPGATTNASDLVSGTLPMARLSGTLPALNGSALTNLAAGNIATGTVPTARLGSGTASSSTFLRGDSTYAEAGGGKVIQVVSTIETAAVSGTAAQGGVTAAMISLAITPTLSSSKILVMYSCTVGPSYDNFATQTSVFRAGTQILQAASSGSRQRVTTSNVNGNNNKNLLSNSYTGLDAPATTSAITYDIRLSSSNDGGTATLYLNRASLNSDNNTNSIGSSSLTLMEIGV